MTLSFKENTMSKHDYTVTDTEIMTWLQAARSDRPVTLKPADLWRLCETVRQGRGVWPIR